MSMSLPPGRRGGGRRAPMAEINVTPLVDVMLVLLIIFMVTAPLLVTGVPIRLPESRARALDQDQRPSVLSIDRDGALFLNDEPVPEQALPQRLAALRETLSPTDQLFLRADAGLDYGTVMRVMGELNRAGLDRVSLVTTAGTTGSDSSSTRSSGDQ
ncbi:biopolymer transport protein TolR/ExbD [Sphingobium sp. SYK-6]|uniref:ExbD/TolR family protein n=1 Tax=Sphingobium sp. (strain NBRC 103272 / SYK-6) TaxID=627192 RepID=UPI0002276CC4|nr:biopolymer transporter ExbD [Sphingobium sp. SYK-6]BAK64924.1 biopolymer transport protein TolR/ExbD [Sphingobium sp. SYK-6]